MKLACFSPFYVAMALLFLSLLSLPAMGVMILARLGN